MYRIIFYRHRHNTLDVIFGGSNHIPRLHVSTLPPTFSQHGPGDRGTRVPGLYRGPGDRGTRVPGYQDYIGDQGTGVPGYQENKRDQGTGYQGQQITKHKINKTNGTSTITFL